MLFPLESLRGAEDPEAEFVVEEGCVEAIKIPCAYCGKELFGSRWLVG